MEYNIVEIIITGLFWFLVGFAIAKARPKDALREALYRANPELKPAMVITVNDKLEILWYRYEGLNASVLATVVTEENEKLLSDWYDVWPKFGDYVVSVGSHHFVVTPESFETTYKRVLTV